MVPEDVKLHLGCGNRFIPTFIHIDKNEYPHIDFRCDIAELNMFNDNSVDLIYACHVLEHLKRYEIGKVLKEWYRVLKKDGILRISVPNFESIVEVYNKYKDMNLIMGLLYGGQDMPYNYHHVAFDFKYLKSLLIEAGFKEVQLYDWRDTDHKDYDDFSQAYIPHMDKQKGVLMSLNVEAYK